MTTPRARSDSEEWDRARRAYQALIAGNDPVAAVVSETDVVDLRPTNRAPAALTHTTLVSGPNDLAELRDIVERATGVGTWPEPERVVGAHIVSTTVMVERPGLLLGLLLCMDGIVEDRSPWRKWRTLVDGLARPIGELEMVTIEAQILTPR